MDGHWPVQNLAVFLHDALVVIEVKRGRFWFWRISAWILLACFDSDQLWAVQRLKDTWAGLGRPFVPSGTGPLWLLFVRVVSRDDGLGFREFGWCSPGLEMVIIGCACRLCMIRFVAKVASERFLFALFSFFMFVGTGETFSLFWQFFKVCMHFSFVLVVLVTLKV